MNHPATNGRGIKNHNKWTIIRQAALNIEGPTASDGECARPVESPKRFTKRNSTGLIFSVQFNFFLAIVMNFK